MLTSAAIKRNFLIINFLPPSGLNVRGQHLNREKRRCQAVAARSRLRTARDSRAIFRRLAKHSPQLMLMLLIMIDSSAPLSAFYLHAPAPPDDAAVARP